MRKEQVLLIGIMFWIWRTTKVEHKAPGMCGQEYVQLRTCVDRTTYRQSKMSKDGIQGPLNLADIFCFQLHVKFLCLSYFRIFLTDRPTDQLTKKAIIEAPPRSLKTVEICSFTDNPQHWLCLSKHTVQLNSCPIYFMQTNFLMVFQLMQNGKTILQVFLLATYITKTIGCLG